MSTPFVAGTIAKIQWAHSGGTLDMSADYRTFDFTPSVDFVDGTAGGDSVKVKIPGMTDATCNITMRNPQGGTATYTALQPGKGGTLTLQPEGTATNKRKITMPAYCNGGQYTHPYNDVSVVSVTFQANGAFTDGVN